MSKAPTQGTLFDALVAALVKAGEYNRDDAAPPAAILWPDEKREWEPLVPRLRAALPQFLIFDPQHYDKSLRTGPAIWLRCVLGGMIPEVQIAEGAIPIIYLPGVARATLRATDECPKELKPLAALQYSGVFWGQRNGRDWTVASFLQTNSGGLQLKVAKDQATAASMRRALPKLAEVRVAELRTKAGRDELNSLYFDSLISDDPVDDLLSWLSDPAGTRGRMEASHWETFKSRCLKDYGFEPERDGELTGAEKLGLHEGSAWKAAWKRFAAIPMQYPGIAGLLLRAKPKPKRGGELFDLEAKEAWPQDNEAQETDLRRALEELAEFPPDEARARLLELEKNHGERREWVWARMGKSPLAGAMKPLAALAGATARPLAGATLGDLVKAYTEGGWQADAAALDALASASNAKDREAVSGAVARVYQPWLRDSAELFQERVAKEPIPGRDEPRLGDVPTGTCVLFADGLRFDVAQKLKTELGVRIGEAQMWTHFSALPSVTPTAKPAVSPVVGGIAGSEVGDEFRPCLATDGKALTTDRFRKLIDKEGFQFLTDSETGDPNGRAWTEYGNLDKAGHNEGAGLARRIPEHIDKLADRIEALLDAGWREVRIVTDHGWLLLPRGLPKSDLPKYLTETRWRRCAVVKPSSKVKLPCFSWFWADDVRIASPPGIDCFLAGEEYSHGGLSLQECVVPQISMQAIAPAAPLAKLGAVKWLGLRIRIRVEGAVEGCRVELRDKPADPASSLTEAKPLGENGEAALLVEDDSREGTATTLVLLDQAGRILDKMAVSIGE